MLQTPEFSREMRRGEEDAVAELLTLAFDGDAEARLVAALRKSGAMAGEVVLPYQGGIVGYYALSQMREPTGWLCLAPVAIHPDWQGRGHGRRMIGMLTEWARLSKTSVVVLGQVPFYECAGFSAARARELVSPYPVEHTLLAGAGEDIPHGNLIYPLAFEKL
ncbi:GNAT family N-acetyltransferase [Roseovarius pelagicus]|uniref:N-acetyltransferase n=1 Tax=Roseovarius pelagicus TaxID=2980108 RepID=A0ABY6DFQ6_9RHOB|nr:N-acetyltransferase [Roseovarius pelagicus]UXX82625.1 N-acetyltransferase [Roseovarius pelagicus]